MDRIRLRQAYGATGFIGHMELMCYDRKKTPPLGMLLDANISRLVRPSGTE